MELYQTMPLASSSDYKERFIAEYYQTRIRYNKLRHTLIKEKAGTLDFKLTCPVELLQKQLKDMETYLEDLEVRAEIEGINLHDEGIKIVQTY